MAFFSLSEKQYSERLQNSSGLHSKSNGKQTHESKLSGSCAFGLSCCFLSYTFMQGLADLTTIVLTVVLKLLPNLR